MKKNAESKTERGGWHFRNKSPSALAGYWWKNYIIKHTRVTTDIIEHFLQGSIPSMQIYLPFKTQTICEVGAIIKPILQIRKVGNREVKGLSQDHTARAETPPRSPELQWNLMVTILYLPSSMNSCMYKKPYISKLERIKEIRWAQ